MGGRTITAVRKGRIGTSEPLDHNVPPTPPTPLPPISKIVPGNIKSDTFVKNAETRGMTPEEWQQHLNNVEVAMLAIDPADNTFAMKDDAFNQEIGDLVVQNMKDKNAKTQKGLLKSLPNKGKMIVIGDLHEQSDLLLSILKDIQSNPKTNLEKNPDVNIVFLGDVFSGSKTKGKDPDKLFDPDVPNPGGQHRRNFSKGAQLSETTSRLMTLLMAKYPDQIHSIMGNHDFGVLVGEKYLQDPTYKLPYISHSDKKAIKNDKSKVFPHKNWTGVEEQDKDFLLQVLEDYDDQRESMLADAHSAHPASTFMATNTKHMTEKLQQTPIAIITGDKSKGEKVRLFVHSPPTKRDIMPDIGDLEKASYDEFFQDPLLSRIYAFTHSTGGIQDSVEMSKMLKKLGVDEVFFGHVGPESSSHDDVTKTDQIKSPVGSIEGGANYIDSQTRGNRSGYMVIDLDKNKNTTNLMQDIIERTQVNSKEPAIEQIIDTVKTATHPTPPSPTNRPFPFTMDDNNPTRIEKKPKLPTRKLPKI